MSLILPGSLEYQIALESLPLPPDWERWAQRTNGNFSIVVIPGTGGIMRCVDHAEASEFVGDGEFDHFCETEGDSPFVWTTADEFHQNLIAA